MLTTLGYEKGDPCPIHCNRGYVDGFDPSKHQFPERMPCPACKIIKEVHGVAPN
jgi:hypothetical protein